MSQIMRLIDFYKCKFLPPGVSEDSHKPSKGKSQLRQDTKGHEEDGRRSERQQDSGQQSYLLRSKALLPP